jgi:hypothetical protein
MPIVMLTFDFQRKVTEEQAEETPPDLGERNQKT